MLWHAYEVVSCCFCFNSCRRSRLVHLITLPWANVALQCLSAVLERLVQVFSCLLFVVFFFFYREQVLCHDTCMHMYMYINTCSVFPLSCRESFYVQVLFREMFSKWSNSLLPVSWWCCEGLCRAKCMHEFLMWICDLAKLCKRLKSRTGRCTAPWPCGQGSFAVVLLQVSPCWKYRVCWACWNAFIHCWCCLSPHNHFDSRTSRRRQPPLKQQGLMTWPVRHHSDVK